MAQFSGHLYAPSFVVSSPPFQPGSTPASENSSNGFGDWRQVAMSLDTFDHEAGRHHTLADGRATGDSEATDDKGCGEEHLGLDMYQFDPEPMSPRELWSVEHGVFAMSPHSLQAEVAAQRSASVNHQFGQLTPPDEGLRSKVVSTTAQQTVASPASDKAQLPQVPVSAKSARARNAANQRHGKAKKAKPESDAQMTHAEADELVPGDKREKYREKNRLAAAKCRAKKKTNVEELEEMAHQATALNTRLKLEARELRDTFSELRSRALMHDPSQGCRCSHIHQYNTNKAHEAARGAITMPAFLAAGMHAHNHLGSMAAGSLGSMDRGSRTQSMSMPGHAPSIHSHGRSHSMADASTYFSGTSPVDMMPQDDHDFCGFAFDKE